MQDQEEQVNAHNAQEEESFNSSCTRIWIVYRCRSHCRDAHVPTPLQAICITRTPREYSKLEPVSVEFCARQVGPLNRRKNLSTFKSLRRQNVSFRPMLLLHQQEYWRCRAPGARVSGIVHVAVNTRPSCCHRSRRLCRRSG